MAKKSNNINPATVDTLRVLGDYETGLDLFGFVQAQSQQWDVAYNLFVGEVEALGGKVSVSVEEGDLIVSVIGNFEGKDIARKVAERLEKASTSISLDKKAAKKLCADALACVPSDLMNCLHWYQQSREWDTTGTFTEVRKKKGELVDVEVTTTRSLCDCYAEFFTNLGMDRVTPETAKKFAMRIVEHAQTGKVDGKAGSHKFRPVQKKMAQTDAVNCVLNYFLNNGWRVDRDNEGNIVRDEQGHTRSVKCGGGYVVEKNTMDTPFATMTFVNAKGEEETVELATRRPANYVLKRA